METEHTTFLASSLFNFHEAHGSCCFLSFEQEQYMILKNRWPAIPEAALTDHICEGRFSSSLCPAFIEIPKFQWHQMMFQNSIRHTQGPSKQQQKTSTAMICNASGSDSDNWLPWEFFRSIHKSTEWQQSTICHQQAFVGSPTVSSAACLILLSPVYLFYISLWLCQSKLHFINLLIKSINIAEIKLMRSPASSNASRTRSYSTLPHWSPWKFFHKSELGQSLTSKL